MNGNLNLKSNCNFQPIFSGEPKSSQPVQMVQYSGVNNNPPKTTLKSLHDPYDDNLSLGSQRWIFQNFKILKQGKMLKIFLAQQAAFSAKDPLRRMHSKCVPNLQHTRVKVEKLPRWFTLNATYDKRCSQGFFTAKINCNRQIKRNL